MSDDSFPVGTFARVTTGNTPTVSAHPRAGMVGRVVDSNGRTVRTVRFPDRGTDAFHVDWLHRVVFVSVRFYGPGMQPNRSEFHGARYVVTGTRGNRQQMTVPHDDAVHSWDAHSNGANAAHAFAISRLAFCDPDVELVRDRRGRNSGRIYAVTERGTCTCSDEYGPCEFHGETLVTREGASVRTADDLSHTFCEDVCSVTHSYPSPEFEADLVRLGNALADAESYGVRWLPDPEDTDGEDMRDTLSDMVGTAEAHLGAHGLSVWWEDGYRIVRVTGGPLA